MRSDYQNVKKKTINEKCSKMRMHPFLRLTRKICHEKSHYKIVEIYDDFQVIVDFFAVLI